MAIKNLRLPSMTIVFIQLNNLSTIIWQIRMPATYHSKCDTREDEDGCPEVGNEHEGDQEDTQGGQGQVPVQLTLQHLPYTHTGEVGLTYTAGGLRNYA